MSEYDIQSEEAMSEFIYKNIIVMIHQIIKANYEAGKTTEEILSIIASLTEIPTALQESVRLKENSHHQSSDGMTDYQFKRFVEVDEERRALKTENTTLREKCNKLTQELEQLRGKIAENK